VKMSKNKKKAKRFPMVSLCTPTFNRRPFIPIMIRCFSIQDYPKNRIEWIIIDDGTDPIDDLVRDIPQVKYYRYTEKMTLGKKRNLMHEKSSGEIIVYMDDDDYYPPQRISHAVETLLANPKALCAGSSEMHCYFKHLNKMYQFGPYGPNHATAATFAFRRELLNQTKYEEDACLAEEKKFLKEYTIPFVQLETTKTILIFSHDQNTFDKKILISGDNSGNPFVKESAKKISDFIKENDITQFFTVDIDKQLEKYKPGSLDNKPDCIKQLGEIKERREQEARMSQMYNYIQQLQQEMKEAQNCIAELNEEKKQLSEKNEHLNKKLSELIRQRIDESRLNTS